MLNFTWIPAKKEKYDLPVDSNTILCIDMDDKRLYQNVLSGLETIPKEQRHRVAVVGNIWGLGPRGHYLREAGVLLLNTHGPDTLDDIVLTREKIEYHLTKQYERRTSQR